MTERASYRIHETEPADKPAGRQNDWVLDPNLEGMQYLEGGGPMKAVEWSSLPKPLRIFGYLFLTAALAMGVIAGVASYLN